MKISAIVYAGCLALGAAYAASIALDAAFVVKERFHGPFVEKGVPSSLPLSSKDNSQALACDGSADPLCTPPDLSGDVLQGGISLSGKFSRKNRSLP